MALTYRQAQASEIDQIHSLEVHGFPPEEAASKTDLATRLQEAGDFMWLGLQDSTPIALINGTLTSGQRLTEDTMHGHDPHGHTLCIHGVVVHESQRRKGIALAFLNAYFEAVSKAHPELLAFRLIAKPHMRPLYSKAGYVDLGVSEVEHGGSKWHEMVKWVPRPWNKEIWTIPAGSAADMLAVDLVAMQDTGPNLFQMMENAGRGLAEYLMSEKPDVASVAVLVGPGGNGGGGLVAARHLAARGVPVTVVVVAEERFKEIPAHQSKMVRRSAVDQVLTAEQAIGSGDLKPDAVIDALLGYSLKGAPRGDFASLIKWTRTIPGPPFVLSLDVASGVDSTTGTVAGEAICADATFTLGMPKTGLVAKENGRVVLADLGLPKECYTVLGVEPPVFGRSWWVPLVKKS